MIVLYIVVLIYFNFNITSIVNVFMLSIEKIQQIEFKFMLETNSTIYWVLEKSKETILEFYKEIFKMY